jgi:hypothetical protein
VPEVAWEHAGRDHQIIESNLADAQARGGRLNRAGSNVDAGDLRQEYAEVLLGLTGLYVKAFEGTTVRRPFPAERISQDTLRNPLPWIFRALRRLPGCIARRLASMGKRWDTGDHGSINGPLGTLRAAAS